MSRFEELISTVSHYQSLAAENYTRVRSLAEELREGLCAHIGSKDGVCVRLVPPAGAFEPKDYGDQAFSVPPQGFRPLGAILFGLAIRVSTGTDWMRVTIECQKIGDEFIARSKRDGLKAALEWREETFGNRYRSGDDSPDRNEEET